MISQIYHLAMHHSSYTKTILVERINSPNIHHFSKRNPNVYMITAANNSITKLQLHKYLEEILNSIDNTLKLHIHENKTCTFCPHKTYFSNQN